MKRHALFAACGLLAATIALEATAIDSVLPTVPAHGNVLSDPGRAPRFEQRGRRDLAAQKKPRLFPPTDLSLLEAPDREQWQKPDLIMDALKIGEGDVVAELGASGGWFTVQLARRVWPNGIVYAEDIQSTMVEVLTQRVQREGLRNVRPVLGTETDPKVPIGLDAVLMVEVFHEARSNGAPGGIITLLKNVARSLKPQGLVGIVEFLPGDGGPGPSAEERSDPEAVIRVVQQAGLVLKAREPVPPFQYLLVFGKGPQPSAQH
jgi:SAM-dependent methyltransferase